jgi:hypothetical protein
MTKNNQETQYSRYYVANLLTNAEILVLETQFKTCAGNTSGRNWQRTTSKPNTRGIISLTFSPMVKYKLTKLIFKHVQEFKVLITNGFMALSNQIAQGFVAINKQFDDYTHEQHVSHSDWVFNIPYIIWLSVAMWFLQLVGIKGRRTLQGAANNKAKPSNSWQKSGQFSCKGGSTIKGSI